MIRKFLTKDGEMLEETEWALKPTDECFYCEMPLLYVHSLLEEFCPKSQDNRHDWVTLCDPALIR